MNRIYANIFFNYQVVSTKKIGDEFEDLIQEKLISNGIECNSTKTYIKVNDIVKFVGDGNIDLFGNYKSLNYIIQCKYKSEKYSVGPKEIREFSATLHKQPPNTVGFFITNTKYTQYAENESSNSGRRLYLCNDNNIVEQIKLVRQRLENEKLKNNSTFLEEIIAENIELDENSNINFYGIHLKGKCKIGKFSTKKVVTRYNPY